MKNLIIPFVIKAHIANNIYADTLKIPRWSPDYTKVYNSALGSSITPHAFTEYQRCLKAGVHLHFILPDAFKHGTVKEGEYVFPTVPNRYVITRMYEADGNIQVKCFIVESDFLRSALDPDEDDEDYTVIPYLDGSSHPYRFMGRRYESDQIPEPGEYLPRLTALGGGDPMFAAYYPTCRSVFGWYDDLHDVPDICNLTYFVLGYFGNKQDDPFANVKNAEDFAAILVENCFTTDSGSDFCDNCVLFGEAINIEWKGAKYYYEDMNPPNGSIDVSFGATSAEAMSAVLAQKTLEHTIRSDNLEYHLTQLQYDLLKQQNQIDGNFKIDDEIYKRTFSEVDPMEVYDELKQKEDTTSGQMPDLSNYYKLRCLQRESGRMNRKLSFTRKKLYYAWENYIRRSEAHTTDASKALDEIHTLIDEISSEGGLIAQNNELNAQIAQMRQTVYSSLPPEYELCTQTAPPFIIPKDPVVMVSGDGVVNSYSSGNSGTDDLVYCQTMTQTSSEVSIDQVLEVCRGLPTVFLPFDYLSFLYQAVLNSPSLMEQFGDFTITGKISSLAVNAQPLALSQLFMDWQADYSCADDHATLDKWKLEYGKMNYTFYGDNISICTSVNGRIPLTPHAVYTLADHLNRYQTEFPGVYDNIRDLPFISQELSGFTDALTGLRQVFQLPVTYDTRDISKEVEKYVENQRLSVNDSDLFPLRGGYIALSKLNIIGTFGQKQAVVQNGIYNKAKAYFPFYMPVSKSGAMGLFPLVFNSETRLTAEFIPDGMYEKNLGVSAPYINEGTDGSPICAIILPELLNNRLILYNENGEYAGMLKTVFRNGKRKNLYIAPSTAPVLNTVLKCFIDGVTQNSNALPSLISLIQDTLDKTVRTCESDFIWGVPLVLAQLCVRFEFFGGSEYAKKWDDFGKYDDKGAQALNIPLKFGNIARVSDGTVGVYEENNFSVFHALWGADESVYNGYVTTEAPVISANDGDKRFIALMVPNSDLNIETGLLPVVTARIDAMYTSILEKLIPSVEINPILADVQKIRLPISNDFTWRYKTTTQSETTADIFSIEDDITENAVMDGFLIKKQKKEVAVP